MKLIRPNAITDAGGSFTRASIANYRNSSGTMTSASNNVPREHYIYDTVSSQWKLYGILIEGAATNLLLNSAALSTQSVSVTAQAYTVSFYGTGSITLSGTATGVIVGTHANVLTTYTFTPTAGSLTLTVTGSVTYGQLETGLSATSWITTTGSTASRAADICTGLGFIYSNVAETDYTAWNAATAYIVGDRVIRTTTTTHNVYERVVAGTTATAPESDAINWIQVSPTNRWKAFDESPSTITTNTETITYILKPGRINSIALLELDGTEVAINLYAGGALQFHAYNDLLNSDTVGNWYEYFFEPFYYQTALAITDMLNAALLDMPMYTDTILTITIRKAASTAGVGAIACGIVYELGKTQNGMSLSIIDYSKKDTDDYGNTILVRRKFSKRLQATFFLYSSKVDIVSNLLTQYRATPVVWIGADNNYNSLVIYGFYRDWNIGIPNNIGSSCTIEIEGLA